MQEQPDWATPPLHLTDVFSPEGYLVPDPKTSPFVGANGEPLLRNSITAFLDILGFSQFCGEHTEIDKAQDLLQRIANAISNARNFLRSSRSADDESLVQRGVVKFFSDNLLYAHACETDADVVISAKLVSRLVQQYQLAMALNGFFVRGGVTQGLICVTDDIINMFCFWHRDSPDCPSDVRIVRTDEESVIRRWTEVSHPA